MDAGDVYQAYAPAVLGYLRHQGVADPEDILGEVFLHVARSLRRFHGDDDQLRRWVFTLAHHRIIDERRRQSRRPAIADRDVPDRAAHAHPDPVDPELVEALGQLTSEQREVVLLRFIADLPIETVAELIGRTSGAVRSLQHRAISQLASRIGASREEERRQG
ncbi:MAG: sigma-70 family RNA polymerase sigma factor [Acidimicrobiales bacterium]